MVDKKKIIGIDLGGTSAKVGILNQMGDILTHWEIATDISDDGKFIVPNIISSIIEHLESENMTTADILGIGMGTPGSVNRNEGTVIGAYNLNWTSHQCIKEQMKDALAVPFFLDNDANVAALGEQWRGAGNEEKDVIFVTLGTGVGGGIISDGNLLHGATDTAGEIGHLNVDPDGYICTCGKKGCLEQYASATGIVRLAQDGLSDTIKNSELTTLLSTEQVVAAKDIFDFAKSGDVYAIEVVDKFVLYLGVALGSLASIFNPSTIVLGGGVSKAGTYLIDKLFPIVREYSFPPIREVTKLKLAELGNDAGIIGAASLVINELK